MLSISIFSENMSLTNKQRVFIDEYLQCFNATEAARRAGYSEKTARAIGCENLTKPDIKAEIEKALQENAMTAAEVLSRLAEMARGDIADFMDISSMGYNLDLKKAQELGLTHLIKKVKQKTTTFIAKKESEEDREITELELELYDAKDALTKLGQHYNLFTDRKEITGADGEELKIVIEYARD